MRIQTILLWWTVPLVSAVTLDTPCLLPSLYGTWRSCNHCQLGQTFCPGNGEAYTCSKCDEGQASPCTLTTDTLCVDATQKLLDALLQPSTLRAPFKALDSVLTAPECKQPGFYGERWNQCLPCPQGEYCPGNGQKRRCPNCVKGTASECTKDRSTTCTNRLTDAIWQSVPKPMIEILETTGDSLETALNSNSVRSIKSMLQIAAKLAQIQGHTLSIPSS